MAELRAHNTATTILFPLIDFGATDFEATPVTFAAGDAQVSIDEGAFANTTNNPAHEGNGIYSLALTAGELNGARIAVTVVDQTATKLWEDQAILIETYGNASAQHAFDLDTATQDVNVTQISGDTTAADNAELFFDNTGFSATNSTIGTVTDVTNQVTADMTAISGDTTAADNLEATYDGTGYVDDNAPATQLQVASIGTVGGGAVNFAADGDNTGGPVEGISFVGVETSGTFASVAALDGTNHVIDDTLNEIDIVYTFSVGGSRTGVSVTFDGFLNSANDTLDVFAYDFVGASWTQIGSLTGQNGTTNIEETYLLLASQTGTGADLGNVYVRFQNTAQTNPTLEVDRLLVSAVANSTSVGYSLGAIWIDTNASNTNTELFVDGVADNPVSTLAAATTISTNLGINRFQIAAGSSITLAQAYNNYEFLGNGWALAFGGQSITGAKLVGANMSGTATTSTSTIFESCIVNAVTLSGCVMRRCFFADTITNSAATDYFLNGCFSRVAGTGTPTFDFGLAVGNTNFNLRGYSGGIELENMGDTGTDTGSIEGWGQVVLNANCDGGTLAIRGDFTLTDNSGNVTLSDDARFTRSEVADAVWDEAVSGHQTTGTFGAPYDGTNDRVAADVEAVSGDVTAADNAELFFDNTGFVASNSTIGTVTSVTNDVGVDSVTAAVANVIADHIIRRSLASARASSDGDAVSFRSLLGAISKLVNRIDTTTNAGNLTIFEEDDSTSFGQQALTTNASADPITVQDTV